MARLRFIPISGTTNVTQNMYVYESDNDIIVVDCGVGFPEEATYGIDLVIPDFTYILKNKNKVRGVLISHGHEDHIGALPFLYQEIRVPIYATRLVAGFIEDKFLDYGIRGVRVNVFDPDKDTVRLGSFTAEAFRVSHSVPDGVGYCLATPVGKFFHVPDYKFDWTPVDQKPFDIARAALLAKDGVLTLASDALGSTSLGYTESELDIEKRMELIVKEAKGRVFFTTISSNISRMQQVIRVAQLLGRKIVFIGRSTEKKAEIAKKLGYLNIPQNLVISLKETQKMPDAKVFYIISGSYGQSDSALTRTALGDHPFLKIKKGDVVIFSADPAPPGTEQAVNYVVDQLIKSGAEVHYYDTQEDLHVSGHGSQKEIEMLFALVKPKYLIPIGGTVRHMRAYTVIAQKMGWQKEQVFELGPGEVVEFSNGQAKKSKKIPVQEVMVDGLGVGDVGNVVLRDRKTLAKEGIVVVVLQIDKSTGKLFDKPDLISRGFVFAREQQDFLNRAGSQLKERIQKHYHKGDGRHAREITIDFLERFFFEQTGRRPMILPVVVEV